MLPGIGIRTTPRDYFPLAPSTCTAGTTGNGCVERAAARAVSAVRCRHPNGSRMLERRHRQEGTGMTKRIRIALAAARGGDRGAGDRDRRDERVHVTDAEGALRRRDDGHHRVRGAGRRRDSRRDHLRPDRHHDHREAGAGYPARHRQGPGQRARTRRSTPPAEGPIIVAPPGAIPAAAQAACIQEATPTAVWLLQLTAAGQTINLPAYVLPTAGAETALGPAKIRFCLAPPDIPSPGGATFGAKFLSAALTVNGVFSPVHRARGSRSGRRGRPVTGRSTRPGRWPLRPPSRPAPSR